MKRFKYLSLAALMAFAACDEGEAPIVVPAVTGTVSGIVRLETAAAAGIAVALSNGTSTSTDGSGAYSFSGVPAGAYTVTISGFASDASFTATVKAVTISTAGQVATANFDGSYILTSAILGSVAAGGKGLQGVTVTLSGQSSDSKVTDVNGQFFFSALRAGSYTVSITNPNSAMYAFPLGTTSTFTLGVGASQVAPFPGTLVMTATVSGSMFIDEFSKDSTLNAGLEKNLAVAGALVTIEGGAVNTTKTTLTLPDGTYNFPGLGAGTYRVTLSTAGLPGMVTFRGINPQLVVVTTGSAGTVNFPFVITTQAVKVGAFLGTDGTNPMTKPAPGWLIHLYDTQANAATGGATGRLGIGTTGADGYTTFRFLRALDVGPNSANNDKVVFARSINPPTNHAPNGETILEIQYPAVDSASTGDDVFDAFNNSVVIGVKATESDGDLLSGWNVVLRNNKDSASATIVQQAATSSKGIRYFTVAGPLNVYPDTLWLRLADGQPGANGHAFAQVPTADRGTAFNRSMRYIWDGTVANNDTIMFGTSVVTYKDVAVTLRAHHEADDSTDVPVYTAGDNFTAAPNIDIELKKGTTTVGARAAVGGTGLITFAAVVPGTITANAYSNSPSIDLLNNKTITLEIDGSDQTFVDTTLKGNAGNSSFAYKFNNNTISGTLLATDGTAAAGVRVKIMAHPMNIQPRAAADTTVKTSAAGLYTTGAKVREGPYIAMALDSVTSTGDSIWAMLGAHTDTADSGGSLNNSIMNFGATRMDTKIQGVVVNDRDSDFNTIDPDEALTGVTINLIDDKDGDGVIDTGEGTLQTTLTDATGAYSFSKLREDFYIVQAISQTNATVLRALSGTGAVTSHIGVRTRAALGAGATLKQNNTRNVGNTSPPAQNDEFPRWDYLTGTAALAGNGVAAGGPNNTNAALTTAPGHFVHLFSTGTITGKVLFGAVAVVGARVTVTRCQTSATQFSPPAAGACTTKHGTPSTHIQNHDTNSTGSYTATGLLEGVYQIDVAPATAGFTNIVTPGGGSYQATLRGNNDIETVPNFVIS